jgi:phospholipase/carboxylesterase
MKFVLLGALAVTASPLLAAAAGPAGELSARPSALTQASAAPTGLRRLAAGAFLYVPKSYRADTAMPLLVMLHGAGHSPAEAIALARGDAERLGFLLLAPKSQGATWDVIADHRFGADARALDALLGKVFASYRVDDRHLAIGGFSDGASYALSLGLANGDLFGLVIAFSPGSALPGRLQGKPRLFVSHGTRDPILPIDQCSRRIVRLLREGGYDVRYEEFDGGHEVPQPIARLAFARLLEG